MKIIKPPTYFRPQDYHNSIFLAGSIEMGEAEDWQTKFINELSHCDYTFVNPRRDDWDASWEQSIKDTHFKEQVEWELGALENCNQIVVYFAPGTKSPISLLELGLFANSKKISVCCPEGFWRKGNVDITCRRYFIPQFETLESLIENFKI